MNKWERWLKGMQECPPPIISKYVQFVQMGWYFCDPKTVKTHRAKILWHIWKMNEIQFSHFHLGVGAYYIENKKLDDLI